MLGETLNGRLPLKHGSDQAQTLPKRVSDDLQHFIFRRRKILFHEIFGFEILFFDIFVRILRSYAFLDFKIRLLAIFCSRYTYSEVCTTKKLVSINLHSWTKFLVVLRKHINPQCVYFPLDLSWFTSYKGRITFDQVIETPQETHWTDNNDIGQRWFKKDTPYYKYTIPAKKRAQKNTYVPCKRAGMNL